MPPTMPPVPLVLAQTVHSAAGTSIPAIRLWAELLFARRAGAPIRRDCLLDTGAPLCVIPHDVHSLLHFAWQPLPGPWPAGFTTCFGAASVVGTMDVWLPSPLPPFHVGPLRLVAKFTLANPPHAGGSMPILLGLNFLAEHRAECGFQCHTPPQAGNIQLP